MSGRCQVCDGEIKIMIRRGGRTCSEICQRDDDVTTRRTDEPGSDGGSETLEHV